MDEELRALAADLIDGLNLEDVEVGDIDPDAPLFGEGLGLDSIDALELAVVVKQRYGVKIEDDEEGRKAFASLRALHSFIRSRRGAETP